MHEIRSAEIHLGSAFAVVDWIMKYMAKTGPSSISVDLTSYILGSSIVAKERPIAADMIPYIL